MSESSNDRISVESPHQQQQQRESFYDEHKKTKKCSHQELPSTNSDNRMNHSPFYVRGFPSPVPFHGNRHRFDLEETAVIRNGFTSPLPSQGNRQRFDTDNTAVIRNGFTSPLPSQGIRQRFDTEETAVIRNGFTSPLPSQGIRQRLDTDETAVIRNRFASPLPSQGIRQRLDTEETAIIRNGGNRNVGHSYDRECQKGDELSVVSGLSKDEDSVIMARRDAFAVSTPCTKMPPSEVMISNSPILVNDYACDAIDNFEEHFVPLKFRNAPPPLSTTGESPVVPRPTMSRHVRHTSFPSLPSLPPLPIENLVIDGQVNTRNYEDHASWTSHHDEDHLLGNRKRLLRSPSCGGSIITVGTLVGQSSLKTAPTITSEISSEASAVKKNFQTSHQAEALMHEHAGVEDFTRKRSIVKEELKHFLGVMASPMRKMPLFKQKPLDLVRSKGTLT